VSRFSAASREVLEARMRQVIEEGEATFPSRHRLADGRERDVEVRASVVADADGPLLFVVIHDVTSRRQLADELARRDRLEVLRAVSGGIAHDFNNVLTTVCGNVAVAREMVRDGDLADVDAVLGDIAAAARSATGLTRQLLGFTAERAPRLVPTPTQDLVAWVVSFHLRGSAIVADVDVPVDLPPVLADGSQLHQVFGNLVVNARQAMGDQGRLTVRARAVQVPDGPALPLSSGAYVLVAVRDGGPGIPVAVLPRVFDPFYTTKRDGQGLGLASCLHIIQQHGGHIAADNPPGGGARFRVWLPVAPHAPAEINSGPSPRRRALRHRALVVDDQQGVRRMLERLGRREGLEVTSVASAEEAVSAVEDALEEGAPFHLALLDLTIPGGAGGREIAPLLRTLHAGLRLVAMTGHPDAPALLSPRAFGFDAGLAKPFSVGAFHWMVAAMLPTGTPG
jgi:two-component system cell cycle sensor histidine kinase/response regulator CckA